MQNKYDLDQLINLNKQLTTLEKRDLKEQLIVIVNDLLLHNFDKLVQILYRVDVSEQKLKHLLQNNPGTDAAVIITDLLVERQDEKIKSKNSFQPGNNIAEEDKW